MCCLKRSIMDLIALFFSNYDPSIHNQEYLPWATEFSLSPPPMFGTIYPGTLHHNTQ